MIILIQTQKGHKALFGKKTNPIDIADAIRSLYVKYNHQHPDNTGAFLRIASEDWNRFVKSWDKQRRMDSRDEK